MKYSYLPFILLFIISCHSTDRTQMMSYQFDNELLDTLVVRADRLPAFSTHPTRTYRATQTRTFDLIHTGLDLRLNWEERSVIGQADLFVRPYFYSTNQLELDAVNFEIDEMLLQKSNQSIPLEFSNNGKKLLVLLDNYYNRSDTLHISIKYKAYPEKGAQKQAYSIGSDQGLFFIDPAGTDPMKPTQVWTQGETEYNSRWFPTIDQPNERCTQTLKITVADSLVTLSNGILTEQKYHPDGMRTDLWEMDLPHAPYLFALVVGEYSIVKEWWRDIELSYYVYPEYEPYAEQIFDHTPEMLEYFSSITGVAFPWQKYAQVIVSDFVSGAMENTTAVVFAEGFQKSKTELVDFHNDMIVAHEMFHHWFGDLVTCESWANLTLNEGFANYAEYLWTDHKYGRDAADYYHHIEKNQYLQSANYETHPLIHFNYADKDAMFDAHSYNKGSLVLHMLRRYLGDEAFFEAISLYLKEHAFSSAEAHDLRLAFETICGEDLNWFFNQWFYDKGHPVLQTSYQYDETKQSLEIDIQQVQDSMNHRLVFSFPIDIQLIFDDGSKQNERLWVNSRNSQHQVKTKKQPAVVLFNSSQDLLCQVVTNYSPEENAIISRFSEHVVNKMTALKAIRYNHNYAGLFEDALKHPYWGIRLLGLQNLTTTLDDELLDKLKTLALEDENSIIRSRALRSLRQFDALEEGLIIEMLNKDSSSMVISYALEYLYRSDSPEMEKYAKRFMDLPDHAIQNSIASIFSATQNPEYLEYFENRLFQGNVMRKGSFLISYSSLLKRQKPTVVANKCKWLSENIQRMDKESYSRNVFERIIEDQLTYISLLSEREENSKEMQKELISAARTIRNLLK